MQDHRPLFRTVLVSLVIIVLISGCRLPVQTAIGSTVVSAPTTSSASESIAAGGSTSIGEGTSASESTSTGESASVGLPTIRIQDIDAGSIDQQLVIEGVVFGIERHSGGNIKLTCADEGGEISVFIPANVAVDDMNLSTHETYRIGGQLQFYRDQLELVPGHPGDIVKVSTGFDFPAVRVVSVVDGDTLHVRYADGRQEKVRVVGIDSPELARAGQPAESFAEQARQYMTSLLMDKTVYLEQDNSDVDRYGRQLRYVWLEKPDVITAEAVRANLVSSILLGQGFAVFVEIGLDNKYEAILREDENQARTHHRGLWMD